MKNHLWYLVEKLAPLSLFNDYTVQPVKAKVADVLNHQINQERPKHLEKTTSYLFVLFGLMRTEI